MQQDGWLNIDQYITENIPGTKTPLVPDTPEWNLPHKDQITIRQLLQHSAGVYDVDNDKVPGCDGQSYTAWIMKKIRAISLALPNWLPRRSATNFPISSPERITITATPGIPSWRIIAGIFEEGRHEKNLSGLY